MIFFKSTELYCQQYLIYPINTDIAVTLKEKKRHFAGHQRKGYNFKTLNQSENEDGKLQPTI